MPATLPAWLNQGLARLPLRAECQQLFLKCTSRRSLLWDVRKASPFHDLRSNRVFITPSRPLSDTKNQNQAVQVNDTVRVNLRIGLMTQQMLTPQEGTVIEFKVGMNELLIPRIEHEVVGMKVSQRKDFTCEPAEGFGDADGARMPFIPAKDLPATYKADLKIFEKLPDSYKPVLERLNQPPMQHSESVIAVTDKGITLDFNHPHAGSSLLISLYLLAIQ